MKNITRAGVDVAKSVFHIHAKDRHGQKNGTIGFSEGTGDTSTISRYSATNEYYLPAKSRGG